MNISVKEKSHQHNVSLFGGRLKENKPLSGEPLYSNLIYWAHVEAPEEGTFPMHPHEGIEILTFIFEGGLEHFDTATNVWTPLPAGGVQHIQSGKGVYHSEKYWKGSRAFQIWFDPDFSKALQKDPGYIDYQAESFQWIEKSNMKVLEYVGPDCPIQTDAPGVVAKRFQLNAGIHAIDVNPLSTYSIYVMSGELSLEGTKMPLDSFTKISGVERLNFDTKGCDVFVLQTPTELSYQPAYR